MRTVRAGTVIGLIAQLALLAALAATVGLGVPGWLVGICCGVGINLALAVGFAHGGVRTLGPADRVTLARATLAGAVAALTADSLAGAASATTSVPTLVALSAVALALDAVDGWVARRTETVSAVGARFDMEIDAFLIMVLSVYVAAEMSLWWVLTIGAARYAFVAAGVLMPWLRGLLPPRYWRKVVAATQGVVLTVAAADVLPRSWTVAALTASLALLAESFGRDVWWLWRRRHPVELASALPLPLALAHPGGALVGAEGGQNLPATADGQPGADRSGEPRHRAGRDRHRIRVAAAWTTTGLACLLVWFALLAPNRVSALTPSAFLRIPLEALVVIGLALILPPRARGLLAATVGVLLGALTLLKLIDMGFFQALDRPFNPVTDWSYLGPAVGVLGDSIGRTGAIVSVVAAAVLAVAIIVVMPLSVLHLTRLAGRHRSTSIRSALAFGLVWVLCFAFGLQIVASGPIASTSAAALAFDEVKQVRAGIADQQNFAVAAADDSFAGAGPAAGSSPPPAETSAPGAAAPGGAPALMAATAGGATAASGTPSPAPVASPTAVDDGHGDLLSGLRGKDVIIAFVEAYGRVAIEDSSFSPQIDATLDAGTATLEAAGFSTRSAFLTSPTFGGLSWLAHATLQSGLWVDSQQRYDQLVAGERMTLVRAFKQAGWRTVADVPSNEKEWPEGNTFYHFDQIYDGKNVGYAGPGFGYASMPDQYVMSTFHRLELAQPGHPPVMAEIDLVSSHWPWAPLPKMVDWDDVGDGSVFNDMPAQGESSDSVWSDPELVKSAYAQSIDYTLNTMISYVQNFGDENLVLVLLGDHQPAAVVTGENASHDVPITIIAHDPAVLNRMAGWGWQRGMNPDPSAPVWPMDSFRDRFLTAYSGPPPAKAVPR